IDSVRLSSASTSSPPDPKRAPAAIPDSSAPAVRLWYHWPRSSDGGVGAGARSAIVATEGRAEAAIGSSCAMSVSGVRSATGASPAGVSTCVVRWVVRCSSFERRFSDWSSEVVADARCVRTGCDCCYGGTRGSCDLLLLCYVGLGGDVRDRCIPGRCFHLCGALCGALFLVGTSLRSLLCRGFSCLTLSVSVIDRVHTIPQRRQNLGDPPDLR